MKNGSPKFDAYIAKAPAYAKPILNKVRALFHQACPEIEETIKWGHLFFEYKGIVGAMSAHKEHVRFGFWQAKMLGAGANGFVLAEQTGYGAMKLAKVSDLPSDKALLAQIKKAVKLNESGVKTPRAKPAGPKTELAVPDFFAAALKKNKAAKASFDGFSPSKRKDYIEWLSEAKQEATRAKRLATALEWLAEGKSRNWKYER